MGRHSDFDLDICPVTITVREPQPGEIETLGKSASECWVRELFQSDQFTGMFDRPYSKLLLVDEIPVAVGGFFDRGDGAAMAWLLVGHVVMPRHILAISRTCRRVMKATPFRRIEAHCLDAYPKSHRLVRSIGFERIVGQYLTQDGRPFSRFLFRN